MDEPDFDSTEPPWICEESEGELNGYPQGWLIKPIPGQVVADVYFEDKAELIVKAVNLHERLVSMLKSVIELHDDWGNDQDLIDEAIALLDEEQWT